MDEKVEFGAILGSTRGRVYLLWALLLAIGYIATFYVQRQQINAVWLVLSATGLGYMFRVMPLRLAMMRRIYLAWLVPIAIGMAVSAAVFYVDILTVELLAYLGAFWLLVQAVAFTWNGLVDPPGAWYYIVAAINLVAAVACYAWQPLLPYQYLVAATVSVWSMLMLAINRAP